MIVGLPGQCRALQLRGSELQITATGRTLFRGPVASRLESLHGLMDLGGSLTLLCFGAGRKVLVEGSPQGPGLLFRALGPATAAELSWSDWTPEGGRVEVVRRARLRGYGDLAQLVGRAKREFEPSHSTVLLLRFAGGRALCFVLVGEHESELVRQAALSAKRRQLTPALAELLPVEAPAAALGVVWLACDALCRGCAFGAAQVLRLIEGDEEEEADEREAEEAQRQQHQQHLEQKRDAAAALLQTQKLALEEEVVRLEGALRRLQAEAAEAQQRWMEERRAAELQRSEESERSEALLRQRLEAEAAQWQAAAEQARAEERQRTQQLAAAEETRAEERRRLQEQMAAAVEEARAEERRRATEQMAAAVEQARAEERRRATEQMATAVEEERRRATEQAAAAVGQVREEERRRATGHVEQATEQARDGERQRATEQMAAAVEQAKVEERRRVQEQMAAAVEQTREQERRRAGEQVAAAEEAWGQRLQAAQQEQRQAEGRHQHECAALERRLRAEAAEAAAGQRREQKRAQGQLQRQAEQLGELKRLLQLASDANREMELFVAAQHQT